MGDATKRSRLNTRWPVPSGFIVMIEKRSLLPSSLTSYLSRSKAISVPSGDQSGSMSSAHLGGDVSRASPVPSELTTKIADLSPTCSPVNAICFPSEDHVNSPRDLLRTTLRRSCPSRPITQMSPPSPRSKAIRVPSGDHSKLCPEVSIRWSVPSAFMR
jgi:hypothetical protein